MTHMVLYTVQLVGGGKDNTQTRARDWSRRCISRIAAGPSVVPSDNITLYSVLRTQGGIPSLSSVSALGKRVFPGKLGDGESECLHSNMGENMDM
jgi:hypothetical protein